MGAHTASLLITILSFLIALLASFRKSGACIAVYWGQGGPEGSLREACDSGYYRYVNLAFLSTFGNGQTTVLDLDGKNCNVKSGNCKFLGDDIHYCQRKNIKVLLSLGGPHGSYELSSTADAEKVAKDLWSDFLSDSPKGPLGNLPLDGVDFAIENPKSTLYWQDLAKSLLVYSTPQRKIYWSAAPRCPFPDTNLNAAIQTGDFDYVWVKFYNNPQCDNNAGPKKLIDTWKTWSNNLTSSSKLFLGLPAAQDAAAAAASTGYIRPKVVGETILSEIRESSNYRGLMLWDRSYDMKTGYRNHVDELACRNMMAPHNKIAEN